MKNLCYNGESFRCFDFFDEEGYFYRIKASYNGKSCEIYVTNIGVSIEFERLYIHTNINPSSLFPYSDTLDDDQLERILEILNNTGMEGKIYANKLVL